MANPAVTARVVPTGYKLPEGFKITIAFSQRPNIQLWEVEGSPAGFEVAEINTTTQHNVRYVSKYASQLIANDDIVGTCGYDPEAMDHILALVGDRNGSVTIRMPDNTTHNYWGFLKSFKFQPLRVGQFPLANYAITVTNWDPVNKVEAGPYTVGSSGT